MTVPKRTCSEPDCVRLDAGGGLCRPHFLSAAAADPEWPRCGVDGCRLPVLVKKRGWCKDHYERWQRHGDPLVFLGPGGPGIRRKPIMWADCQACGVTFEVSPGSHGKFCTRACFRKGIVKTCPECNVDFRVKVSKDKSYTYCSLGCRQRAAQAMQVTTQCEHCGKAVTRAPSLQMKRWCSWECNSAASRVFAICKQCGKEYSAPSHRMPPERKFCSTRCGVIARLDDGPPIGYMANKLRTGYRTDIEQMAEDVLIELGVEYWFEKKVGRFLIDFALPDFGIGLECDGWFHTKTTERDAHRDTYLLDRGWRIVRISDKPLRTNAHEAILSAIPELSKDYLKPHEQLHLLC